MRVALSRALQLAWSMCGGRDCLAIRGLARRDLERLAGLRLAVLPTDLVPEIERLPRLQPVAGRVELDGDTVYFVPRFPFVGGVSYSVLLDWPAGAERWSIERPRSEDAPLTEVVSISPTGEELPANQLKLYVQFSNPMSEGWAQRAVHIREADGGEPLAGVLLDMDPELWDPERRRLTLLFDPGRIKRGLVPNLEAGYPLVEGGRIVVVVDRSFRDAEGRPLRAGATREYVVGPPIRKHVAPADWRVLCPSPATMEPLRVEFDRPLDRALLERCLSVADGAGAPILGDARVGKGERSWVFVPHLPWSTGRVVLEVDARLEDLAGNSVARVFDRDLTRPPDARREPQSVGVELRIAPR